jgi:hypothetical protein
VLTDRPPRKSSSLREFQESDHLNIVELSPDDRFRELARKIESAINEGSQTGIRIASAEFLATAADFYKVRRPDVRALSARPLRVREGWQSELFGDYTPSTSVIRIWTRTAVHKRVTSFGTLLSTLSKQADGRSRKAPVPGLGNLSRQSVFSLGKKQPKALNTTSSARSVLIKRLGWSRGQA